MEDYIISVGKIEEWQMTNDLVSLDIVFDRAKREPANRRFGE